MNNTIKFLVNKKNNGKRLDVFLAENINHLTRSFLKKLIEKEQVKLNKKVLTSPATKVKTKDQISINIIENNEQNIKPKKIKLDIIYEDNDILVINKPKGMVVHPGAGNPDGTLLNGLLHKWPELSDIPRAGIIHRLDKETSGLMIVTKNLIAHNYLVQELSQRKISREYDAICYGVLTGGGTINEPIARHRTQRKKMSVDSNGKDAITHYRVIKRFRAHTHIKIKLETGRTHQIRVHFVFSFEIRLYF